MITRLSYIHLFTLLSLFWGAAVTAQNPPAHAITNAALHLPDGSVIASGSIVWRDGVIEAAGSDIELPFDAYTVNGGDSLHIYPGLIDGLAIWGSPPLPDDHEQADIPGDPGYDRAGIQPNRTISSFLRSDTDIFEEALKHGFTTALLGFRGYMLPGIAEIYFLNGTETGEHLFRENYALQFQFRGAPGGWGNRAYPTTTMGVMARFRQLIYDAEALSRHMTYYAVSEGLPAPRRDEVLESLFPLIENRQQLFFTADSREDIERFLLLKDEFSFDAVLVSGGEAYLLADELVQRNIPLLASLDLPEPPGWYTLLKEEGEEAVPQVSGPEEQHYRERQMDAWLERVKGIRTLLDAGVRVGFASNGLSPEEIEKQTRILLDEGELSPGELLKMMTRSNASILEMDERTGDLVPGMTASFSVWTRPTVESGARIVKTVSNGVIHEF